MDKVTELVSKLPDATIIQIIYDYEDLSESGVTGNTELRRQAEAFMKSLNIKSGIMMWMTSIATACYRHYALKYIELSKTVLGALQKLSEEEQKKVFDRLEKEGVLSK